MQHEARCGGQAAREFGLAGARRPVDQDVDAGGAFAPGAVQQAAQARRMARRNMRRVMRMWSISLSSRRPRTMARPLFQLPVRSETACASVDPAAARRRLGEGLEPGGCGARFQAQVQQWSSPATANLPRSAPPILESRLFSQVIHARIGRLRPNGRQTESKPCPCSRRFIHPGQADGDRLRVTARAVLNVRSMNTRAPAPVRLRPHHVASHSTASTTPGCHRTWSAESAIFSRHGVSAPAIR